MGGVSEEWIQQALKNYIISPMYAAQLRLELERGMGKEEKRVTIIAAVSRHNTPQDKFDDAVWELFLARIAKWIDEDQELRKIIVDVGD